MASEEKLEIAMAMYGLTQLEVFHERELESKVITAPAAQPDIWCLSVSMVVVLLVFDGLASPNSP